MGAKKRKPLRSNCTPIDGAGHKTKSVKVEFQEGDASRKHIPASIATKSDKSTKRLAEISEEDEWEKIELHQSKSVVSKEMNEDAGDSSDDYDDDDDDDEIKLEGSIEHDTEKYTFEFNDMREEYTEGICVLLRSLVQNPTKAYDLARTISSQSLVGTVVACEGGSDTFAFATVLPLSKEQLLRSDDPVGSILQDLTQAVKKSASSSAGSAAAESFLAFFGDARICTTGVLLHKRFSNLPIQLVGALHVNLEEDLGWAQHNHESDDSEQNEFRSMQSVLLLCSCSLGTDNAFPEGRAVDVLGNSSLFFEYFEDEMFLQSATSAYLFKPKASATSLLAAIVPIASLKKCVNAVCLLIPPIDV